jgi:hypothetical protein
MKTKCVYLNNHGFYSIGHLLNNPENLKSPGAHDSSTLSQKIYNKN